MPYTKKEAHVKIQKLVEDFRAQEATLEKAPEAQIEQNFIRPLFRYLNWNTENKGLSHAHYEFRVQATNRKGLRPDYILHLDGRNVLVMDAKQVKYAGKLASTQAMTQGFTTALNSGALGYRAYKKQKGLI